MGMIGNQLAAGTALTVANDSFNGTGSATAFTLSQTVSATTDIEVLVDNVQQSPYDSSYSVSGTTLTFSAAPAAGTNNIYVIYNHARTITTNQVIPDDASVTHSKLHTNATLPITRDMTNNRVGINATSPYKTLTIAKAFGGSAEDVLDLQSTTSGGGTAPKVRFGTFAANSNTIGRLGFVDNPNYGGDFVVETNSSGSASDATTEKFRITKEGYVKTPSQPLAVTYYNSSTQHGAYGAGSNRNVTTCKPGAYRQDIGNLYSTSTGRYTITQPGVYRAGFNGSNYNNGISNYYYIFIRLNGTIYSYSYQSRDSAITWAHLSGETYLTCAAGDYIDFYQNHDSSGADKGGFDINQYTTFYVELVR